MTSVENTVSAFSTALVANPGTGDLLVKQLIGGTNVSITSTDNVITINASPGSAGVASVTNSPGVDIDLVTGTDSNPVIKQLVSSSGISLEDTGTSIIVTNTDPGSTVGLSSQGGTSLVSESTGPNLSILGLSPGTGIGLTSSDTAVTITNTSPATAVGLSSQGGTSLVSESTGPNLSILGLSPGTGIGLTSSDTAVTITNTSPATAVGLSSQGGTSLVSESTGPNLSILGLSPGTGIGLTSSDTAVTITNTSPATAVGLSSQGGTSLVSSGIGPNLSILGLGAGDGITLDASDIELVVTNSSPVSSLQLTNVGEVSLVPEGGGTGASPTLMGLTAGSNIALSTDNMTNVTISVPDSSFQPPNTQEALTVATGGSVAVSPVINVSFVTITGTPGMATGTLGNGTIDGFIKTVSLVSTSPIIVTEYNKETGTYQAGSVPYVLTVTNYINVYGTIGPYAVILNQSGSSISFQWNSLLGAWQTVGEVEPLPSPHSVEISLDPSNSTIVRAITNTGIMLASGLNVANTVTTTVSALFNSVFGYLGSLGGGDVFIRKGTYYLTSTPAVATTYPNMNIIGESDTILITTNGITLYIEGEYSSARNLQFTYQSGFSTTTVLSGITYGVGGGIQMESTSHVVIRDCTFISLSGCTGAPNCSDIRIDSCTAISCRGGHQFSTVASSGIFVTNCYCVNMTDDTINFGIASNCIAANNFVDMTPTIGTNGGRPLLAGNGTATYPCTNISFIGNRINNTGSPGCLIEGYVNNIIISGNTFNNCCNRVIPIGSPDTPLAALWILEQACTNVVVTNNTFTDGYRPICCWGQNCYFGGNSYSNNVVPNVIAHGNTSADNNSTLGVSPNLIFRDNQTTFQSDALGASTVLNQTGHNSSRVGLNFQSYSSTSIWQTSYVLPVQQYGAQTINFTVAIGSAAGPLPNSVLTVQECGDTGAIIAYVPVITTVTFTIPLTGNILTDAYTVISVPFDALPRYYAFTMTGPTGTEVLNTRYTTTILTQQTGFCNAPGYGVGVGGAELDYVWNGSPYTPTNGLLVGEQGAGYPQMAIGPLGTPVAQIAMYNVTGTYPAVSANSETIIGPLTVISVSGATPVTTDQIFISSTGALPVGLLIGGAYCNASGQLTFKVANFTTSSYAGGGVYNLWFQGVSQ